jgi:hypothetical protein
MAFGIGFAGVLRLDMGVELGWGYPLIFSVLRGLGLHHCITALYSPIIFMELQYRQQPLSIINYLLSGSFGVVRLPVPLKSDLMHITGHDSRP